MIDRVPIGNPIPQSHRKIAFVKGIRESENAAKSRD